MDKACIPSGEGVGKRGTLIFSYIRIVRPVKRDWAVLSKDTPVDISI